jgi:TetR/AcrR family transcriptional regulator, transcriptional repressor for nem operon
MKHPGEVKKPCLTHGELAQLSLSVMEGGVMQARTHRTIEPYDASVRQLRAYVDTLRRTSGAAREQATLEQESGR